jgi:lactoylglutathione lyase
VGFESLISGVAHIGIRVFELSRSRKFYEDLGFEFIAGPLGPEPVAILRHPAGIVLNLILNGSAAEAPNVLMDVPEKHAGYTHMSLLVHSLDEATAELTRLGLTITEGPIEFPGARFSFVRDPDGNVVELHEATAP